MKKLACLVFLFAALQSVCSQSLAGQSRYDYSQVAAQLTAGCTTDAARAEAIDRWLCANIAYDTSYTIHTADECWDQRKGICQAYCELFRELGLAAGLKVEIIIGNSKDWTTDQFSNRGHAWIWVNTEDGGMLIDPTWGAGSVKGEVFTRSRDDRSWFDVDPYWMILTHLPDDPKWQLLPSPVSREEFMRMMPLPTFWSVYGFDGKRVFEKCRNGEYTSLPMIYSSGMGRIRFHTIPMQRELRVGTAYDFVIEPLAEVQFALIEGRDFHYDWNRQGAMLTMRYVPTRGGELMIAMQDANNSYNTIVQYHIADPTPSELARVEASDPFAAPEFDKFAGYSLNVMRQRGVDGAKLLQAIRNAEVTVLPKFYTSEGYDYSTPEIPLNGTLKANKAYTLVIESAAPERKLAVINNNRWFFDWEQIGPGRKKITITPAEAGSLKVMVQQAGNSMYSVLFEYNVE